MTLGAMAYPRFQFVVFDSSRGLQKMEDAVNSWLLAATPDVYVTDRQTLITNRTSLTDGKDVIEPYVVVTIWYTGGETPITDLPDLLRRDTD